MKPHRGYFDQLTREYFDLRTRWQSALIRTSGRTQPRCSLGKGDWAATGLSRRGSHSGEHRTGYPARTPSSPGGDNRRPNGPSRR